MKFPFTKKSEKLISDALTENKVFVFPTETFYGLGGNAFSKNVVDRIFNIKGRPIKKTFILLINMDWIDRISVIMDSRVNDLIDRFWPGPLTLVLKAKKNFPDHLKKDDGTVAVRHTSSIVGQRLVELGSCPIIGTSANISGSPPCFNLNEVKYHLKNKVDFFIDGGDLSLSKPSTIVNCVNTNFKIIRNGAISLTDLNGVCEVYK